MGVAGCPGIPGRIKSVWVAGCYRYRWPDDPGIRTIALVRLGHVFLDGSMAAALPTAVMNRHAFMSVEYLNHTVG